MSLLPTARCENRDPHTAHEWPTGEPVRFGCPGTGHHAPAHRGGHTTDVCVCTPDEARELARLRAFVADLATHGIRADLMPTMNLADVGTLYKAFAGYLSRINATIQSRAIDALDGAE